jgi:hypothetical protein
VATPTDTVTFGSEDEPSTKLRTRSTTTRCTAAMIGTRMAKVSQSSRAISAGIAVRAKPAMVNQTTANSKAAAAGLSPERSGSCRAGRMTLR